MLWIAGVLVALVAAFILWSAFVTNGLEVPGPYGDYPDY